MALFETGRQVVMNLGPGREETLARVKGRIGAFFVLEHDDGTGMKDHEYPLIELMEKVIGRVEGPVASTSGAATSGNGAAPAETAADSLPGPTDVLTALTLLNVPREVRIDWEDGTPPFWARAVGRNGPNVVIAFADGGAVKTAEHPMAALRAHVVGLRSVPLDTPIVIPENFAQRIAEHTHASAALMNTTELHATLQKTIEQARATGIESIGIGGSFTLYFVEDGIKLSGNDNGNWEYHIANDGTERMVGSAPSDVSTDHILQVLEEVIQGKEHLQSKRTWTVKWNSL